MGKLTKRNKDNIKDIFERETGVTLEEKHSVLPVRTLVLVCAIVLMGLLLTAFTVPLFSPLDGDALTLSGSYAGDGIVSVRVKNDSDKVLQISDAKLFSWNDGEVELLPGGRVILENTRFEPHSEGYLTVDLSDAYDIEALETTLPGKPKESWYYLLLTNHAFSFGHDWMCSFHFVQEPELSEQEPASPEAAPSQTIGAVEEELRFYFEDAYYDVLPAFSENNFVYQQKVQELLLRREGTFVRPVDPWLLLDTPENVIFDETVPEEEQSRLIGQGHYSLDGYRRMVGSVFSGATSDFALQISGTIPREAGQTDGGVMIPLRYLFTYEAQAVQQEGAYAFVYGQILTFSELDENKVYSDEQYVVYDVTELFYTDLDAYIDAFVSGNSVYFDETLRQRLHNINEYYSDRENLDFSYHFAAE